jgi:Flp pilus assembly protein TadD
MRLNKTQEAEAWLRQTIALDPKAAAYHTALAAVLDAQGRRPEAIAERSVGRQNR